MFPLYKGAVFLCIMTEDSRKLWSLERFTACQNDCVMHFAIMSAAVHGPEPPELLAFIVNTSWCLVI